MTDAKRQPGGGVDGEGIVPNQPAAMLDLMAWGDGLAAGVRNAKTPEERAEAQRALDAFKSYMNPTGESLTTLVAKLTDAEREKLAAEVKAMGGDLEELLNP